ncbi:MAG: response regulator [Pseudomonadota bacterium]
MNHDIGFEGKTVLLVEDELFLLQKISQQLETLGFRDVLSATNLADAKEHTDAEDISVALLDVNLADGETTIELGHELSSKSVPVVFFSGFSVDESAVLAASHDFLEKPLSVPRIKAALQRALLRSGSSRSGDGKQKMAGPEARQSG